MMLSNSANRIAHCDWRLRTRNGGSVPDRFAFRLRLRTRSDEREHSEEGMLPYRFCRYQFSLIIFVPSTITLLHLDMSSPPLLQRSSLRPPMETQQAANVLRVAAIVSPSVEGTGGERSGKRASTMGAELWLTRWDDIL